MIIDNMLEFITSMRPAIFLIYRMTHKKERNKCDARSKKYNNTQILCNLLSSNYTPTHNSNMFSISSGVGNVIKAVAKRKKNVLYEELANVFSVREEEK